MPSAWGLVCQCRDGATLCCHSLCSLPARLTDCLQFYSLVLSGRTLSHRLPQVLTAKGTHTCLDLYQNISLMRCQGAGGLCPQLRAASPLFS